jgi:hypothetical protein
MHAGYRSVDAARRSIPVGKVRCTYCGRRGDGSLLEADVRGVRYDYCDAACATAHRMAVELTAALCPGCDADAAGDTGCCAEHLEVDHAQVAAERLRPWRRAG